MIQCKVIKVLNIFNITGKVLNIILEGLKYGDREAGIVEKRLHVIIKSQNLVVFLAVSDLLTVISCIYVGWLLSHLLLMNYENVYFMVFTL